MIRTYFYPLLLVFIISVSALPAKATEGMWLPFLLEQLNEKEMRAMGMKMTAKDIYDINKGSLKDAVVQFGGGCTAELISGKGLLLTNHHCGYGSIQSHTTLENNYLRDGFWAKSLKDELVTPGLTVTFISRIDDVSAQVLEGTQNLLSENERQSTIDKNINKIKDKAGKKSYEKVFIRPFFDGNRYFMFVTITYEDVRLVGAPPSSIGKFGSDTDNWVWPRHTGDFSMFRIYAGKDNLPAPYSPDNVPYTPKHFLPVSMDGVEQGDFTMVFGFPGRTSEYLPASAVKQIQDLTDPLRIGLREQALKVMDEYMRQDEAIKIKYASTYAGIANYWKKWMGEVQGLKYSHAVDKRIAYESGFLNKVNANPELTRKYSHLLTGLEDLYQKIGPYNYHADLFNELIRNSDFFALANRANNFVKKSAKNQITDEVRNNTRDYYASYFKNYDVRVDRKVVEVLLKYYHEKANKDFISAKFLTELGSKQNDYAVLAAYIIDQTILNKSDQLKALFEKPAQEIATALSADYGVQLFADIAQVYSDKIEPQLAAMQPNINALQRDYMKAQMEVFPEKKFYPDANSTLRVTYGKAEGYSPKDAVQYDLYTYMDGMMEKYIPGDYEFDLPQRLIDLYNKKDFGPYGVKGKMPVCFIGSNHTTGGNSGSPAIDAYGNLIGLNFDRVWEGTMSDINYDPKICRNIMVDTRYILFIIDKYAGAGHLIKEMKLVNPKKAAVKPVQKKKAAPKK